MGTSFHLLFVCTGNTCRSPIAEGIFNQLSREENLDEKFRATSAGLAALQGSPASEFSALLCGEEGIDLSGHRGKQVTKERVDRSSLILAMTGEQKRELLLDFPSSEGKVFTLKEFVGEYGDIRDPIGMGEKFYRGVYREIRDAVKKTFEKVKMDETGPWK